MKKYTFVEFVAALDSKDFDSIEPSWLEWATKFLNENRDVFTNGVHEGDCTKQAYTCHLCCIERLLEDYRHYYFQEDQWRKDNF